MRNKLTKKEQKALTYLTKHPNATVEEVSKHMGGTSRSLGQYYINVLRLKGVLTKHELKTKYKFN